MARRAAKAPRQVANTHALFSLVSAAVLIWFTGPLARLAERIVPARRGKVEAAGGPRYLGEAARAAPALGRQRARLEVGRLGELVLNMARRGPLVAIEGTQTDLEVLRTEDIEVGR